MLTHYIARSLNLFISYLLIVQKVLQKFVMSLDTSKTANTTPWYEAYPEPSTKSPPTISRQELLKWINEGKLAGKDYIVVDVRGKDHVVYAALLPIPTRYYHI